MNPTTRNARDSHPPQQAFLIGDYALISDCHAAALVSRRGSIDWCCMQRFDSEPCFGRLLDWQRAGFCSIAPAEGAFLVCSFWLAECLTHQQRYDEARATFDRAAGTANDFGLFAESVCWAALRRC